MTLAALLRWFAEHQDDVPGRIHARGVWSDPADGAGSALGAPALHREFRDYTERGGWAVRRETTEGPCSHPAALDSASLLAGRKAMRSQTEQGSGKRIGLRAKTLLVPIDLEQSAWTILNTDKVVGSGNNDRSFAAQVGIELLVVDYWTDANNWFLVADPADVPTIEVGFFQGREEPELFLQDEPTNGNVFAKDVLTYKIRHIYGGAVADYRGFYGALVA